MHIKQGGSFFSSLGRSFKGTITNIINCINPDKEKVKTKNDSVIGFHIDRPESFPLIEENEKDTSRVLETRTTITDVFTPKGFERVFYVTDIHLMHKLEARGVKSYSEAICRIREIAQTIIQDSGMTAILIIAGDISSDYEYFSLFAKILREEIQINKKYTYKEVIFTLGNHELWNFPNLKIDEIVSMYRETLDKEQIRLLQNDLLYFEHFNGETMNQIRISERDLENISVKELRERLRESYLTIFGGIGFSGCNNEFNANNGIYLTTIDRNQEIEESDKINAIYQKILQAVPDKKVIVVSHMPMDCWSEKVEYHKGYIYVSGHTHRNYLEDDGETRVYADNQIGYGNVGVYSKFFEVDATYDYFADYEDGIYTISLEDYRKFYRGTCINMRCNWAVKKIYMLKKHGYYCFIHDSQKKLSIFNGGRIYGLVRYDIDYYYSNMDKMIAQIKKPLDKYTEFQRKIADEIKRIGGNGKIHGCIIDIDWSNHVYVNPVDLKLTVYWAADMVYKLVYPDIASLIRDKCPEFYENYKQLRNNDSSLIFISAETKENVDIRPVEYLSTDIYSTSFELCKMQRLESKILTTWKEQLDMNDDKFLLEK